MSRRPRPELPKELYLSLQTGEIAKVPSFEGWTTGDVQQWKSEHQRYVPAAEALGARPGPQVSPPKTEASPGLSEDSLVRLARTLGIVFPLILLEEDRLLRRFGEDRVLYQAVHKRLVERQKERHPDVGIASLQRAMHSLLANPLFGGDLR